MTRAPHTLLTICFKDFDWDERISVQNDAGGWVVAPADAKDSHFEATWEKKIEELNDPFNQW